VSAIALIPGGESHFGEPRRVTGGYGPSFEARKPAAHLRRKAHLKGERQCAHPGMTVVFVSLGGES